MPSNNGQCYFNSEWLFDPEFKGWLKRDEKYNTKASCKKCHSTFSLGNMGRGALKKHAKGEKHKERCKQPTLYLSGASSSKITAKNSSDEAVNELAKLVNVQQTNQKTLT